MIWGGRPWLGDFAAKKRRLKSALGCHHVKDLHILQPLLMSWWLDVVWLTLGVTNHLIMPGLLFRNEGYHPPPSELKLAGTYLCRTLYDVAHVLAQMVW